MNIRSFIFAAFAAFVLPLALPAQGIADLANPDDIMLRRPAKPVRPVVRPVAQPAVRVVDPLAMPNGLRPGETMEMARARMMQNQQQSQAAAEQAANVKLMMQLSAKTAAEKLAAEKLAAEQAANSRLAAQLAAEKAAAEKLAAEKAAAEKLAAEKAAAEQAAAEKLAAEKAAAEKLAAEKAAAAKAEADRKEQENAVELAKLREQVAASEKAREQAEARAQAEREAAEAARVRAQEAEAAALASKKKKLEAPVQVGDVAGAAPEEAAKRKPGATIKVKKTLTGRPAVITADRTDYDRKEGVILFDRNVYVDDEQYQMHADRLFVFLDGTNDLKRIVALGNVSITNESKTAACAKAVYSRADQRIIMFGENEQNLAWLRDAGGKKGDSSEISGMRITYWFDSEIATVEGVKVTVPGIKGNGSPKELFGPNLGGKDEKQKGK